MISLLRSDGEMVGGQGHKVSTPATSVTSAEPVQEFLD